MALLVSFACGACGCAWVFFIGLVWIKGAEMSASLDNLTNEVAETKGAIESAIVLINGLAQEVRDLKNAPNVDAAIDALSAELDGTSKALAAAVAANQGV